MVNICDGLSVKNLVLLWGKVSAFLAEKIGASMKGEKFIYFSDCSKYSENVGLMIGWLID